VSMRCAEDGDDRVPGMVEDSASTLAHSSL
jgi:hypothetical protein